jgi:hypothetical protein
MKVNITAKTISLDDIQYALGESSVPPDAISFSRKEPADDREIVSAVLVAMISTGGVVLGALVTGLFQLIQKKLEGKAGKVVIQTEKGRIEVPANLPMDKLDQLLDRVKKLEAEEVNIYLG